MSLFLSKNAAFTLIEMLVVLAIAAILMMISIGEFGHFLSQTHDDILQDQLLHTLQFAQTEARLRNLPIAICKSADQKTCGGNWLNGQLIFINPEKNGILSDQKKIISIMQMATAHGLLFWRVFPKQHDYLLFLADGKMPNSNGTFWYCHDAKTLPAWAIILSKTGKVRVAHPNKNGVILDSEHHQLSCE